VPEHNVMKAYMEGGGKAQHILNLGSRWWWVVT